MISLSKLNNLIVDKDPLSYSLIECLLYYDGPMLSIVKDSDGKTFIYLCLDIEDNQIRFCYISITDDTLSDLIGGRITLRNMIFNSEQIFLFDLIGDNQSTCYLLTDSDLFPQEYLPDEDAYL